MSETKAETPYKRACREACKWCAEGVYLRDEGNNPRHQKLEDYGYLLPYCTAPTRDEFEAQQQARIEALERQAHDLMTPIVDSAEREKQAYQRGYLEALEAKQRIDRRGAQPVTGTGKVK